MSGNAPGERIIDPRRIERLLAQLRTRHATLAARAGTAAASTLILDVDPVGGTVTLDGLFPPDAQAAVAVGAPLSFSTRLDGVTVHGALRVRRVDVRDGEPLIVADVPRELQWAQRRAAFRVPVGGDLPSSQVLHAGERYRARLVDVSVLGIGAQISGQPDLSGGAHLTCELHLPGDTLLLAGVEVRSAARLPNALRIGGRYTELTPRQRHALEQATAKLQRDALQRAQERVERPAMLPRR